ncbi:lipocalin family protein [Luteolibacter sp. GHJ8]|uniref:Lipocalin family protein n=1 Tax=Luteolibacter rhizosphaerae TaxID=2989719 RepID=A0ABT3G8W0_9BACT|nr:lipocalin family protein [Luteolibacter rhizosphaerae]MCW1915635.1 lipocalin family protein [Luteolibacter rhizosphaerae]
MTPRFCLPALALAAVLSSCAADGGRGAAAKPLKTTGKVSVDRYAGKWFEIARYPKWFQSGCESATAEYSKNKDGTIKVVNTCIRADGSSRKIEGVATPVDATANRLKVTFPNNWYSKAIPAPKEGNYWIIDLSPDYRHVIVGTPDRKSLWFLSRSATIPAKEFERMKTVATGQGFDMNALVIDGHTKIEKRGRATVPVASARPAGKKR